MILIFDFFLSKTIQTIIGRNIAILCLIGGFGGQAEPRALTTIVAFWSAGLVYYNFPASL